MARRVYFAFHYQDVIDFRANVVRNHWMTKPHREAAGFFDASLWEDAKKHGDVAIKKLINAGLEGTSTTCVLIGSQTFNRRWVTYEIMKQLQTGQFHSRGSYQLDYRERQANEAPGTKSAELSGGRIFRQWPDGHAEGQGRRQMDRLHGCGWLRIVPDRWCRAEILGQGISFRPVVSNV